MLYNKKILFIENFDKIDSVEILKINIEHTLLDWIKKNKVNLTSQNRSIHVLNLTWKYML